MGEQGQRRCVFCGSDGPFHKEDVWPKWIRKIIHPVGMVYAWREITLRPFRTDGHLRLIVRRTICRPCNNGWMSELEAAVEGLLRDVLTNNGPVIFSENDRSVIARWACMKAWTIELANRETYGYSPAHIPSGHLDWLRTHDAPPPGVAVSMFRFRATDDARSANEGYLATMRRMQLMYEGDTSPSGHLATFTLGFGGFQVQGFDLDVGDSGETAKPWKPPQSLWPFLIPLWPFSGPTLQWPPRDEVTFGTLLDRVATWDGALTPP